MAVERDLVGNSLGALTDDAVLGGRLALRQPARGHRVGHDAILLAAATAATAGETAVDLGAGVGAAGLALALRVPDLSVRLIDIDRQLAALAAENAARNGLASRVSAHALDAVGPPQAFAAAGLGPASADRVLMNPPFHDVRREQASPDALRKLAHVAPRDALGAWVKTAGRLLRAGGTLTLIHRADALNEVLNALARDFGAITVQPVHSKPDMPAIRILVRAVKSSGAPLALMPALVLNGHDGRSTAAAEAVLRGGAILPLAELG
jgi:tRNA1(Val) A37 N6-methylase TrmN6